MAEIVHGLPRAEWRALRGYIVHGARCDWQRGAACTCGLVAALLAFLRAMRGTAAAGGE